MTIRDLKGKVNDRIPIRTALLSVFDKSGLDVLVPGLVELHPDIQFLSTGGTYKEVEKILEQGGPDGYLSEVAQYTGAPEMEGGLVKTLHPLIYGGILAERNNPAHQDYLAQWGGDYIDLVVVNLYPFEKVIEAENCTFEHARGNIDIGGPTMIRAAAKNFPGCAALTDPEDYSTFLRTLKENDGCTTFDQRLELAQKVFGTTQDYDGAIWNYMIEQTLNTQEIRSLYGLPEQ